MTVTFINYDFRKARQTSPVRLGYIFPLGSSNILQTKDLFCKSGLYFPEGNISRLQTTDYSSESGLYIPNRQQQEAEDCTLKRATPRL